MDGLMASPHYIHRYPSRAGAMFAGVRHVATSAMLAAVLRTLSASATEASSADSNGACAHATRIGVGATPT